MPTRFKKRKLEGSALPSHYISGDYESDQSEHNLEAGRRTLACGRSCVADRVDVAIIAPHVHSAVDNGRRGEHIVSGREAPHFSPRGGAEGINVVVIAPDVDRAVDDGG